MDKIDIKLGCTGAEIDEKLHSQFIEFLGTCIDSGIWVGEQSEIPHIGGLRKDLVEALQELKPPVIRFPGGCFADTYHWRDGIGDKSKRPVSFNTNFGTMQPENHHFGTHEFMQLCNLVGAKPWFGVNMLSGSVQEMCEWAEYCNRDAGTTLTEERTQNGSAKPFNVEYWGIGNESWAGGGSYTAAGYAAEYRKYATAFPRFPVPGKPFGSKEKLIAVGPDGNKPEERVRWTKDFFEEYAKYRPAPLYGYDLHFYNWNLSDPEDRVTAYSKEAWYRVLAGAGELEEIIHEQHALVAEGMAKIRQEGPLNYRNQECRLIVGEWGNWHRASFEAAPALFQQCTMRDALTTALTLDIFHRNADKVEMACAAQAVNVLNSVILTFGDKTVRTPNFHVYRLYEPHRGAKILPITVKSEKLYSGVTDVYGIHSFASLREEIVTVNVVNTDFEQSRTVLLSADGKLEFLSARSLGGMEPESCNTAEAQETVAIQNAEDPVQTDTGYTVTVPKASVTVYRFKAGL